MVTLGAWVQARCGFDAIADKGNERTRIMNWSTWVLIVLGVIVLLAVLVPLLFSINDINRYFKIRKM